MGKKIALDSKFKIVTVPLPPEKVDAWKAAMRMLLDWIREEANNDADQSKTKCASPENNLYEPEAQD